MNLVKDLKSLGVRYCMLSDYISSKNYNDVDILVAMEDKWKLKKAMHSLGYTTYQNYYTHSFYHKYDGELIRLHFHFGYFFDYLRIDDALANAQMIEGVPYLSDSAYASTIKVKISEGRPKAKYLRRLKKLKVEDECDRLMKDVFEGDKWKFRYSLRRKTRKLLNFPAILWVGLKGLVRPFDYVVFMGTDGSGKTSTTKAVAEYLKKRKFRLHVAYGGRFKFKFLPLNFLVGKVAAHKKKKGVSKDVIQYKSKVLHCLTPFMYYLEYLLRYVFLVAPRRRLNNFVISDRSFLDVIISPNTNDLIARILYRLVPRPKVVYLYNSLDVVHKRRPEHPKEDIKRQQKVFQEHMDLLDIQIKTENPKQTLDEVLRYMFS